MLQTAEWTDVKDEEDPMISIGDVSKIVGVPTHTIRYWEKEFPNYLIPPRTLGRQRRYGSAQIVRLKKIFTMLKEDGLSIAGAKRALAQQNRASSLGQPNDRIDQETAEKIITLLKQHLLP